ncbi:MAG: ubiquinol-cytochrome c reductase iron-sulfur subunit [Planctomycetota bacterium]
MAAISAGTVGYPILAFLKLPASMSLEESIEVSLDDLPEDGAYWGEHMGRQLVIVKSEGEVRVFNGACTHLGCIVHWDGASRSFKCPCHGASFNAEGEPVAGPVNTPLRQVRFEIENGVLTIS